MSALLVPLLEGAVIEAEYLLGEATVEAGLASASYLPETLVNATVRQGLEISTGSYHQPIVNAAKVIGPAIVQAGVKRLSNTFLVDSKNTKRLRITAVPPPAVQLPSKPKRSRKPTTFRPYPIYEPLYRRYFWNRRKSSYRRRWR